jgi:hypothetical protein
MIFNNGMRRTGGAYSSVDEIAVPVNDKGTYDLEKGKAYGPDKLAWTYTAAKKTDFYAPFISGAERMPNGNTLICSGTNGTVFEVTTKDEIVWKYVNPTRSSGGFGPGPGGPGPGGPGPGGPGPGGPGFPAPKPGQLLPTFLHGMLELSDDQKKDLQATEKDLGEKLVKMLTDEQKKKLEERPTGFDMRNFAPPGQLLAPATQERLKLTKEQEKQLAELQKEADGKLDKLFKDDQKKKFKDMVDFMKRGPGGPGPGGPGPGGPGPGGPGPGGPGPGSPGGFGMAAGLFRAPRYAPDFPGLAGKELKGTKTIEELQANPPKEPSKGSGDK